MQLGGLPGCRSPARLDHMLPALLSGPALVTSQQRDVAFGGCPKERDTRTTTSPATASLRSKQATQNQTVQPFPHVDFCN